MKVEELHPRIKIRSPLRCDGIGRLDCAEDTESGARLAVRWLPLDANGENAVRACAKLPEHPTLPRVHQTGQVGDKAFLAMEFPDGQLLATLLGEPLKGDLLLEMGAQLADALATIHSQNVFHGELSAESVLLAKGKAYLWDMPLVIANRLTDRRGEERLMHQLVRSAPYLSPERARGGAAAAEGDVYALAAVMCLGGGSKPPSSATTLGVVHAIVAGEWQPAVPPVFHEPFRGLLNRMLAREPSLRPTAREVADLLGKPAPAIPTIPEMPAVVLPKPLAKSPFASAPGTLEPMLPTKAVAEAAMKVPTKPLEVKVPTQVEPTVEVKMPLNVLAAMSQPMKDSELKAAIEAVKPVPVPAPIYAPSTRTLEFGTAAPKPILVSPLLTPPKAPVAASGVAIAPTAIVSPLFTTPPPALAKAEKTPPPMLAPRVSDVHKALAKEKTPPPAIAPTVSELHKALAKETAELKKDIDAPITAPNPPPLPRHQSRELPIPPHPSEVADTAETKLPPPAVELHENICVSAETYAGGAMALHDEEAEAIDVLPKSKPTFLIAAAILAVVTTGLGVGVRAFTHRTASVPVAAAPVMVPQPVLVQPELDVTVEEDELPALPVHQPKRAAWRGPRRSSPSASRLEGKYNSHDEPAAPADDFSARNSGNDEAAGKENLKRPSF